MASSDYQDLKRDIDAHDKELHEQNLELERLKIIVHGSDGGNGIRGRVKELEESVEEIKIYLPHLKAIQEIKTNLVRIFWLLLLSGLMALGSRYISIKIGEKEKSAEVITEVKTAVEQQIAP